jgi:hypothetical protein
MKLVTSTGHLVPSKPRNPQAATTASSKKKRKCSINKSKSKSKSALHLRGTRYRIYMPIWCINNRNRASRLFNILSADWRGTNAS